MKKGRTTYNRDAIDYRNFYIVPGEAPYPPLPAIGEMVVQPEPQILNIASPETTIRDIKEAIIVLGKVIRGEPNHMSDVEAINDLIEKLESGRFNLEEVSATYAKLSDEYQTEIVGYHIEQQASLR